MIVALAAMAMSASAQDEKWYGSREGGFAMTFNANPVLNYVGNMFNGTTNNTFSAFEGVDSDDLFGGVTISGKYFLKDNLAVVAGFGFNNNYDVSNNYSDPSDREKLTSFGRNSTTAFMALVGGEYRLQAGRRLQPIFGANLVYVHTNSWNYNESTDGATDGDYHYSGAPANKIGLMLNAGVEYFISTQISVGANLDFAIAKTWFRRSVDNKPDPSDNNYSRVNDRETFISTGNFGANITLNFYF